jgi:pimeloyl-ACP methyl ester carboxylesterase
MCKGPALTRSAQLPGVRLHYLYWPGTDPPVVLLHPNRTNARVWDHVVAGSRLPHAFFAPDHRGHGHSDWPAGGYDLADYLADDVAFLEQLGRGPVVLVGAATGGTVGLLLATQRPDLVRALVVVDPGLSLDPGITADVQQQIGQRYPDLATARAAMPFSARWSPAVREHFADHSYYQVEPGVWAPRYLPDAARHTEAALQHDLWDRIAPACPVLAVRGQHSRVFDRSRMLRLAERAADCLLVEIPGADHRVGQDNPTALAGVLDAFVRNVTGTD